MAGKDDDILISVSTDLTQIKRQLRELGQSVSATTADATKKFETAGRSIDRSMSVVQDAINRTTGSLRNSGREWQGALAAPSQQLEELRRRFVPLYAESRKYEEAIDELNRAHKIGALSAAEFDAALEALNASYAKLSAGANVAAERAAEFARLSQKYNPLIAAQSKYEASLAEVSRAEKIGALSATNAIQERLRLTTAYNAQIGALNGIAAAQKNAASAAVAKVTITPNRAADIAAYGKALDDLRKKFNPLYAAQQQYLANLKDIKTARAVGAISTNEMAAAITAEKAAFAGRVAILNGTNEAHKRLNGQVKLSANQMLNLSRQGNDVITMFALGAPPMQIFASQAGQIYDALEQGNGGVRGSLKAIGNGVVGLATKFPLATAAMAAAGVALAAYAVAGGSQIKSLDDIVKSHDGNVKLLGDAWDEAAAKKRNYAALSAGSVNALNDKDVQDAKDLLATQIKGIFDSVYKTVGGGAGSQGPLKRVLQSQFEPFKQALDDLANTNDVKTFIAQIDEIASVNPKLGSARDALRALALEAANTAAAIPSLAAPVDDIADTIDKFNRGMADVNSQPLQKALQDVFDKAKDGKLSVDEINAAVAELERANPSFAGIIEGLKAIIFEARGASQAVADAYAATGGSPNGRHVNPIGIAADRAVEDAQRRGDQFTPSPAPNREDVAAANAKRTAKAAKAKTADSRFFEDIEAIKARTQALAEETSMVGRSYGAQEKRKVAFDLEQKALKEVREEARKKGDQDWKNKQLSADQIKAIDEVSTAYAAQAEELRRAQKVQDDLNDRAQFFGDLTVGVLDDITSGADGLEKALKRVTAALAEAVIKAVLLGQGPLASIFGTQPSNGYSVGGLVGSIFNKQGLPSSGNSGAANVVTNAVSSGVTKALGGGTASGAAYSVGSATNFIKQYAAAIGIDPSTALKVAKSEGLGAGIWQSNYTRGGFREPSFGPFQLLKGGKGTGFGAGLGNAFQSQTGLDPSDPANWQQSTAFALNHAKQNGWGAWFGAKGQGITGFDGIDRSAKTASVAISNLTAGTTTAAKGLGDLGTGMGKFGNALNQFPSAPSGGGGGSWLSSLFGGLNSAFSGTKAFSWLSANPGSFIGLFADGTDYAPGGMAIVGEEGPELINLPRGSKVFPADATRSMLNGSRIRSGQTGRRGAGMSDDYSSSASSVHVTVGVAADGNGNLMPFVQSVAQSAAARSTAGLAKQVPKMVDQRTDTRNTRRTRA